MYEKLYQAVYAEMNMMKKSYNPNKNTTLRWSMAPNPRSMLGHYGSGVYPPLILPTPPPPHPQPKSPRGPCLLFT